MQKIYIKYQEEEIDIAIDRVKIFFGNDVSREFHCVMGLKKFFEKKGFDTEYARERDEKTSVKLDDIPIIVQKNNFFILDPYFDFDKDRLMRSDSLLQKYVSINLEKVFLRDMFSQLAFIYESFEEKCIRRQMDINLNNKTKLSFSLEGLSEKWFQKSIIPLIIKDGFSSGQYDLSLQEILLLQLRIIESIAGKVEGNIFIIYRGNLNKEIIDVIYKFSSRVPNTFFLLFGNSSHVIRGSLSDYALSGKLFLDLFYEKAIEDHIIMNMPFHMEEGEVRNMIARYIEGENDEKIGYFRGIL